MGKFIKKFNTHAQYAAYINGQDAILPNVSYCVDNNDVHYNPIETRLIVKYLVDDDSEPTLLYGYYKEEGYEEEWVIGNDLFDKIEIDNVEVSISDLDTAEGKYQLSAGEHTVKYTLKDPTLIAYGTFYVCTCLTSIEIPNSVVTIGNNAFRDSGLTSITIPNSVTSIGNGAFQFCNSLTSVTIGNSVTTIGGFAFYNCTGLTSITIPNSVTTIGKSAFSSCTGLTSITIGSGVTTIGESAFSSCTGLTSITIPNSVSTISSSAFSYCRGLTSITIPNSVTSIGSSAFSNCSGLTSVAIPNSVTTIGCYAFSYCSGLTSVTIGNSVTSIGSSAFRSCTGITSITSLATTAPSIQSDTFSNIKTGGTLYVPTGSTGYDIWMSTDNFYLGKYGWTKIEQ